MEEVKLSVKRRTRRPSPLDAIMKAKGYLSAASLAAKLGVSPYTIYRWEEEGRITGQRIGVKRYILVTSVAAYLGHDAAAMLGLAEEEPCTSY